MGKRAAVKSYISTARELLRTGGAKTGGLQDERKMGISKECRGKHHRNCSVSCTCPCHQPKAYYTPAPKPKPPTGRKGKMTREQHIACIEANMARLTRDAERAFASKKLIASLPVFRAVSDEAIAQVMAMTDADLERYHFASESQWRDLISFRTTRRLAEINFR